MINLQVLLFRNQNCHENVVLLKCTQFVLSYMSGHICSYVIYEPDKTKLIDY